MFGHHSRQKRRMEFSRFLISVSLLNGLSKAVDSFFQASCPRMEVPLDFLSRSLGRALWHVLWKGLLLVAWMVPRNSLGFSLDSFTVFSCEKISSHGCPFRRQA